MPIPIQNFGRVNIGFIFGNQMCGVIDFIQCLELGIDNPLIIKRIVDHFPAQSHRRAETIVKRMIPRQIQRIVRAVRLI